MIRSGAEEARSNQLPAVNTSEELGTTNIRHNVGERLQKIDHDGAPLATVLPVAPQVTNTSCY